LNRKALDNKKLVLGVDYYLLVGIVLTPDELRQGGQNLSLHVNTFRIPQLF
jgi:hypothetical protein